MNRQTASDEPLIEDDAEPSGAETATREPGRTHADAAVGTRSAGDGESSVSKGNMHDAGFSDAGSQGIVPLGGLCATTDHCKQDTGSAVCCGNTCTLEAECVSNPGFLPCNRKADCSGKVCCELKSSEDTMRFCTKPSACRGGTELP